MRDDIEQRPVIRRKTAFLVELYCLEQSLVFAQAR